MSEVVNIPQLRFPEFSGEWQRARVDKVADIIDPHPSHRAPAINSQGIPFIGIGDIFENGELDYQNVRLVSKDIYREHKQRYQLQVGDFAFGRVASIGKVIDLSNNIGKEYTYSPTMAIIKPHSVNSVFLQKYSNSEYFMNLVRNKTTGSTRKSIGMQSLRILNIALPSKSEQQKIAAFLSAVDTKIEQLSKKQALLSEYKKGLMQKIFSQEVRFKADAPGQPLLPNGNSPSDGSEFPDWEEKQVDEFMEVTRGQVLAVKEMRQEADEKYRYPVFSSQTTNNGLTGYYSDYLFENCITWTTDGAKAGKVKYRKGKFYCTNVCGVLKSDKGYTNLFIAEKLNSISKKYVSYVGNPKLMNNVMSKIKIIIPLSIEEQTKIANFLTSIDSKIEQVGKQLRESKQFKKALLQQMFV